MPREQQTQSDLLIEEEVGESPVQKTRTLSTLSGKAPYAAEEIAIAELNREFCTADKRRYDSGLEQTPRLQGGNCNATWSG